MYNINIFTQMSDIKLTYIFFKLFLFVVFIIFGYFISKSKTKKTYWCLSIIPIFIYSFVEGLRFGRLIDYNLYYYRYIDIGRNFFNSEYELIFKIINYVLYNCGIPYWGFIFLQCIFLMVSTFIFLENFKDSIKYALPIVLGAFIMNENFIRWYIAFSFILLSMNSVIKNNKIMPWVWGLCGVLTHFGTFFYIFILLFSRFINRYSIKPTISIILFLIFTFFISISNLTFLVTVSDFLIKLGIGNLSETLDSYLNSMNIIISGEFGYLGVFDIDMLTRIRHCVICLPGILFGKKYMQNYKCGLLIYNLFVIGSIVYIPFASVELLGRISDSLLFFQCIVTSVVFINLLHRYVSKRHILISLVCLLSLFASYWPSVSIAFQYDRDNEMLFIWDANGREALSI